MTRKYGVNIDIDGSELAELAEKALGPRAAEQAALAGKTYENQVFDIIGVINRRQSGQAILAAIERQAGPTMEIQPYFTKKLYELPNASAEAKRFYPIGDHRRRDLHRFNTLIRYTPAHWGPLNPVNHLLGIASGYKGPGMEKDEMLLHEMIHGLRMMAGLNNRRSHRRVPFQPKYDGFEEFFAILIANIYRSECRRAGLRRYHGGVSGNYNPSDEEFLSTKLNRMHIRQLRRQHKELFNDLMKVAAPFNPLRDFRET